MDPATAGLIFGPQAVGADASSRHGVLNPRATEGNTMGTLKLRRRRTVWAAGLATFTMVAGVAAVPAQAVDKTKYIALGDSYAAGQGAGPYQDACSRSEKGP